MKWASPCSATMCGYYIFKIKCFSLIALDWKKPRWTSYAELYEELKPQEKPRWANSA